jgi:hypothetical protein
MAKLFIWERVNNATTSYDEGGIVVVADDILTARLMLASHAPASCGAVTEAPDHTFELAGDADPRVVIFPDAGCC